MSASNSPLRLAPWALLLLAGAACEDDPPVATGNLIHPAGMSVIIRTPSGEALGRSDLLIADGEAQGVRILQLAESLDDDGDIVLQGVFVPAPVALFNLAVSAPGFPLQIVVEGEDQGPVRGYVLAPTRSELHALSIEEIPFGETSQATNFRVGGADLRLLEPGRVPVDLESLGRSADGSVDYLAILFDGLGSAASSLQVVEIDVDMPSGARSLLQLDLPAGSRDLARLTLDGGFDVLASSSVASSSVAVVSVATGSGGPTLADFSLVDAGGPVSGLVPAGALGMLALRLDRAAAAWLQPSGGTLVRSSTTVRTGFDDYALSDAEIEPGALTLRSPGAVSGASAEGAVSGFATIVDSEAYVFTDERELVMLAHVDGRVLFIDGTTEPRITTYGDSGVSYAYATARDDGSGALSVEGCQTAPVCADLDFDDDDYAYCDAATLGSGFVAKPIFASNLDVRVSPRGTLVWGRNDAFSLVQFEGEGFVADIVDLYYETFDEHRLEVGDAVRVGLRVEGCGGEDEIVDAMLTGEVREIGTGTDDRQLYSQEGARVRAFLTVTSSSSADPVALCPELLQTLTGVALYEVHVPDDVDEAVVAQYSTDVIDRVFERTPMTAVSVEGGTRVQIAVGASGEAPLRFTVDGPVSSSDPFAPLACELRSEAAGDTALARCRSDASCGASRSCGGLGSCPGECTAACADTAACFTAEEARVCPSLSMVVRSPLPLTFDARGAGRSSDVDLVSEGSATVPVDVVWHANRKSFFVSYPGSSTLVEVPTLQLGGSLRRVR